MSGPAVSERRGVGPQLTPFLELKKSLKFSHFLKGFCRSKMRGKLANNTSKMTILGYELLGSTTGRCVAIPRLVPHKHNTTTTTNKL